MGALPSPQLDPGPHRELVEALHELHHQAGWPSLRALARQTGVSHTTVSKAFSSPRLPSWGALELLVEALDGDTNGVRELWLAATAPAAAPAPALRIAGRTAELAAVRRHLETGSGLFLVAGEAGMGKTALVDTAAAVAGTTVVTGRCFPLSADAAFMPIADALRALHDVGDGRWLEKALAACPPYVTAEVARLLPELAPREPLEGTSEWARQRLVGALQSLLTGLVAVGPLALLLEDVHWADTSTLDLMEHIAAGNSPVPVVATWRFDDPVTDAAHRDWWSRVRRVGGVAEVALAPLSRAETAEQLAHERVGLDAGAIFARSRGHPLFTAQLAAHGAGEGLPALLADLLDTRLGTLAGPAWLLARTLGLADRPLGLDQLAAAAGIDDDTATAGLRKLADRRLLDRRDDTVALAHPLLAEAVRRRLLPGEGPRQHRGLAEALGRAPDPVPAEVAMHWQLAGDVTREMDWRVAAARAAADRFDHAQEAEQWLRVLQAWTSRQSLPGTPPVSHAAAYLAAMESLQASLQFDQVAEMSNAAEAVLGSTDDAVRAELLRYAAMCRGQLEGPEVGRDLIDQALAVYDRLPACQGLVKARDWKQNLLMDVGQFDAAQEMARSAVATAAEVGDPTLVRRSMTRLAWHAGVRGNLEEARMLLDDADAQLGTRLDPLGIVRRSVIETDVLVICGARADEVLAAGAPGMTTARELAISNYDEMLVRFNTTLALLLAGRVSQASKAIPDTTSEAIDLDRWPMDLLRAAVTGLCGDVRAAGERMERLWQEMAGNWGTDVEVLVIADIVNRWGDDSERHTDRLLTALDILAGSTPVRLVAPAMVAAARAAADTTTSTEAASAHERHRDLFDRSGLADCTRAADPYLWTHSAAWTVEMARLRGTATVDQWVRVATAWEQLDRPHDAAYCRWRAADVARRKRQGTLAARLLRSAAIGAREHLPLSAAIATTVSGAR